MNNKENVVYRYDPRDQHAIRYHALSERMQGQRKQPRLGTCVLSQRPN
ncbi:MAG: hypothetical protein QOC76_1548 [Mycobacterium sp.]|jgi:hypothetical protein|nr:hypothetical protein [Mycobacterium sp.]